MKVVAIFLKCIVTENWFANKWTTLCTTLYSTWVEILLLVHEHHDSRHPSESFSRICIKKVLCVTDENTNKTITNKSKAKQSFYANFGSGRIDYYIAHWTAVTDITQSVSQSYRHSVQKCDTSNLFRWHIFTA